MEAACFVIGVVSLLLGLLAIPPILQMNFGRPKIILGFDEFTGADGKQLLITIQNRPTEKWLQRFLVERQVGNVIGYFDIRKLGSNEVVSADNAALMYCAPTRETGLVVRALPAFTTGFPVIHFRENHAWIINARKDQCAVLNSGPYVVDAQVICGEKVHRIARQLRIGEDASTTHWT